MRNGERPGGFTLIELLVAIGIMGLLMALLLPSLEKARESAIALKCANNLRTIGQSLSIYSNENHGAYPRTRYVPEAPLAFGTNASAPDPFGPGGPVANDVTAALFLLVRDQRMPVEMFVCPLNDVNAWERDPSPDAGNRSNFTDYKKNLGYSFANPYPGKAAEAAGYTFTNRLRAGFAVAADMNPGTGDTSNSKSHERAGENVLYADGHVQWEYSPLVGIDQDNIYTAKSGAVIASPVDAEDSVLLPIQP
jgi:prepilin-type N-terminal cleavage/methylation domain-containing protein